MPATLPSFALESDEERRKREAAAFTERARRSLQPPVPTRAPQPWELPGEGGNPPPTFDVPLPPTGKDAARGFEQQARQDVDLWSQAQQALMGQAQAPAAGPPADWLASESGTVPDTYRGELQALTPQEQNAVALRQRRGPDVIPDWMKTAQREQFGGLARSGQVLGRTLRGESAGVSEEQFKEDLADAAMEIFGFAEPLKAPKGGKAAKGKVAEQAAEGAGETPVVRGKATRAEAERLAKERIEQAVAGTEGEVYIAPQVRIDIGGKQYLVNTRGIVKELGYENAERLNYYRKPAEPTPPVAAAETPPGAADVPASSRTPELDAEPADVRPGASEGIVADTADVGKAAGEAGAIIATRMGDFYELSGDDAARVATALGREVDSSGRFGMPYFAIDRYQGQLAEKGITLHLANETATVAAETPAEALKRLKQREREIVQEITALRESTPNRRDYYPDDDRFQAAMREHEAKNKALQNEREQLVAEGRALRKPFSSARVAPTLQPVAPAAAPSQTGAPEAFSELGAGMGRSIREADLQAAEQRMGELRQKYPSMTDEQAAATPLGQQIQRYKDELAQTGARAAEPAATVAAPEAPAARLEAEAQPATLAAQATPSQAAPTTPAAATTAATTAPTPAAAAPTTPAATATGAAAVTPARPSRLTPGVTAGQPPAGTTPPTTTGAGGTTPPVQSVDDIERLRAALAKPQPTRKERWERALNSFLTEAYDRVYPAKDLERKTGIKAYTLARLVAGAPAAGESLVEQQVFPVIKAIGSDVKRLEEYMVLKRAEDLRSISPAASLPGGIAEPGVAIDALKRELGPERWQAVEDAAKQMWDLNAKLVLRPMLAEGMITTEQYTAMRSLWPHYIPFHRQGFDLEGHLARASGTGKPADLASNYIKSISLDGSERGLDEPLARWQAQVIRTQIAIARNKAAKALVEALEATQTRPGELVKRGVTQSADERMPIHFFEAGQRVDAQVPALYAKMAKGLDAEPANVLSSILGKAAQPLRVGAVTFNAEFLLVNPFRDAISAWYKEKLIPFSPAYLRGWKAAITHNADFHEAAQAGGLMSGFIDQARSTDAMKQVKQLGGIRVNSPADAVLLPFRLIAKGNEIGEQATRIAVYHKLRAQGIDKLEAGIRMRDVSVDFGKSGNSIKAINQAIPFLNAGIQGSVNTVAFMKSNPKMALLGAAPLAAASMLAFINNQRYETNKMRPDYEDAIYWNFIIGEGTRKPDPKYPSQPPERFPIYVKIPKGPMGAFLTAPVEAFLKAAWAQDDRSVVEHLLQASKVMGTAMSPVELSGQSMLAPGISTALQLESNKGQGYDYFRRRTIIPEGEMNRPPEARYGPESSKVAIALGQQFKVSPRLIDFAIADTTAGTGTTTTWLASLALEALGYKPDQIGEAKRQQLTETEQLAQTPVVKRFLGTKNTAEAQRSYEKLDRTVDEARRRLYENPEVRRFGIGVAPATPSMTVGEQTIELTPAQRMQYQRESTELALAGINALTATPYYQALPDDAKRKALTYVSGKMHGMARANIAATLQGGKREGQTPALAVEQMQPQGQQAIETWVRWNQTPQWYDTDLAKSEQLRGALQEYNAVKRELQKEYPGAPLPQRTVLQQMQRRRGDSLASLAAEALARPTNREWTALGKEYLRLLDVSQAPVAAATP